MVFLEGLAVFSLLTTAQAHSHLSYLIINGLLYRGFDPSGRTKNPNNTVGWSTTASDDGFVPPSNYTTPDIICHQSGTPPSAHAPVQAGDSIHVQWNGWPLSHHGPAMAYLAPCLNTTNGCAGVDKTALLWSKIDNSAPGFLNETGGPPGLWASDVLIASNNSWQVRIPSGLEPGPYVLRHELLALHFANQKAGAQNYPQCVNLWVTAGTRSSASLRLTSGGVKATDMYKADDPGVFVDIYQNLTTYVIPGPTVVSGADPVPLPSQTKSMPTAAGTPVLVSGKDTRAA
jgi:cellulase